MTVDQGLAFAIVIGAMALFIWGRPRYDIVACLALLASVAAGLVKPADAFNGFSDDIVVIVGSALVVSAAIAQTGVRSWHYSGSRGTCGRCGYSCWCWWRR